MLGYTNSGIKKIVQEARVVGFLTRTRPGVAEGRATADAYHALGQNPP